MLILNILYWFRKENYSDPRWKIFVFDLRLEIDCFIHDFAGELERRRTGGVNLKKVVT